MKWGGVASVEWLLYEVGWSGFSMKWVGVASL